MPAPRELDVRPLPPPRRHPAIFGAFDALQDGEAFVLVNDHDPKPLLYQFQAERPGCFDWSVLGTEPTRFRVEIRRRPAKGGRTVAEFLEGDHRRLDGMVQEVRSLADAHFFREAGERFAEFACGLGRHMEAEEQVLFPALEQGNASTGGPTSVMREEHSEIRRWMADAAEAIPAGDPGRIEETLDGLTDTLTSHNTKEELVLYPMVDQAAGTNRARDDLVRRLQTF